MALHLFKYLRAAGGDPAYGGRLIAMWFAARNKTVPGRLNPGAYSAREAPVNPLMLARRRKLRWLIATSLTGISGIAVLSAALFLTSGPVDPLLATKPVTLADTQTKAKTTQKNRSAQSPRQNAGTGKVTRNVSVVAKNSYRTTTTPKTDLKIATPSAAPAPLSRSADTDKLAKTLSPPPDGQLHGDLLSAVKDKGKTPDTAQLLNSAAPATRLATPEPGTDEIILVVSTGDTLFGLLMQNGVNANDAQGIITGLKPVFLPKNLKQGQVLTIRLHRDTATGENRPASLELKTKKGSKIAVKLNKDGKYERVVKPADIALRPDTRPAAKGRKTAAYQRARARIISSFYKTARSQNLPAGIINKMTRILSYDVDFQREVNRGDTFEVLYSNKLKSSKRVLFVELATNRKKHAFYRFKTPDGTVSYYNTKGQSAQKTFMRTPVNASRITSRFGRRKHPTLGYTKMHTGVDFGAARGTPIYAAASGTIKKAGWAGGYGKYVRIAHSGKLATAYAHMSRIAKGIRPGRKVSQGQIIGYVGSTGRSTGPHLHYEIRVNNKLVNPMRYKMAGKTKKLSRKWLALFKKEKSRIDRLRKNIPVTTRIATAQN